LDLSRTFEHSAKETRGKFKSAAVGSELLEIS
jgi:hypothetical protein